MELEEGRMLIDIDSRKPLKFTRKVTLGDKEVTIQIAYDLLFKHFSTCGRLTHEKEYCPVVKEEPRAQIPLKRAGVFARVQVPHGHYDRQPLLRNQSLHDREHDHQVDVLPRQTDVSRTRDNRDRYQGTHMNQCRGLNNSKHDSHYDRIIRARDERPRSNRYGGSHFGNKPYDRFGKEELTWREKAKEKASVGSGSRDNVNHRNRGERSGKVEPTWREKAKEKVSEGSGSMDVVPYERTPTIRPLSIIENRTYRSEGHRNGGERSGSTNVPDNDQMIGALNDMDMVEPFEGVMMECDDHADDLLGEDLMDKEDKGQSSATAESSRTKANTKESKRSKTGTKLSAPLGIQTKKTKFLRRGSPRMRSTKSRHTPMQLHLLSTEFGIPLFVFDQHQRVIVNSSE
ncbi:hypothetical protein F2Q68_00026729 [Brassica cretica]|uniref:Zinc knuckle CX2CX4HX4C domain-containing protein n=2 Tax=Brassica cretica TaxID=69181 RepID=A0A8S9IF20_BRACR|nr:hypothetical protein F2Q68_00026729 [Brassica cretica]KAF3576746.1 hypothetical protein DY000_02033311 [Brassica cretica]